MKDIIMLDLVKICENIDRYDRLVMGLHGVKLEYQGGLEHVTALKKDPHQIASLGDIFSFKYRERLATKVEQQKKQVEDHLTKVARASLLTMEHLDNVMLPWLAQTTAKLLSVPDWEYDDYCSQYINFRPQYQLASRELSDYFKEVELRSGSYVYLIESQGAFNHKCDRYLREIEFKSLNFRTTVASLRLMP
jgi:hypothetical protein